MTKRMNIVILAAGKGTRMRSKLPKVLQVLAGKPMLDHVLEMTQTFKESKRILVIGHGAELLRERYGQEDSLEFAFQAEQLGTGHALKVALECSDLDAPKTLVCFGDVPLLTRETVLKMIQAGEDADLTLLTLCMDNPEGYGRIVRNAQGFIEAIVEEKDASPEIKAIQEINTGIMLLPTSRLPQWLNSLKNNNAQGEYYLTDIIALAAREGLRVNATQPIDSYEVEGVNSKVQLAQLERQWQLAQAQALLKAGVTLMDPNRIDIRGELICGQDVEIDVGCIFEGKVKLLDGVKVGPYCVIKDATVEQDSILLPYCHIDDAQVGQKVRMGPFSRLRPGTSLAGENHIGNFVEIKKSLVAKGSKVNHLTYIGDTDIGERVNVGAGTITCNYDGVNKFRTTIEDDAFIGSGTQLVAPVVVGKGATIGAGTTLTRNAPAGQLTVARARQMTIEGWKHPVKK